MSLNATEHPVHTAQISRALERQVADLIAAYEVAMEKLATREKAIDSHFELTEQFLNKQIDKVNALMADLRELMTEPGAARFRLAAQELLSLGNNQVESLRKISTETNGSLKESCSRFERTANTAVKNINDAVSMFKVEEFKTYVEQSYNQVKTASITIVEKIADVLRWFHWKNLALALGLSLVISVIIGLYINDEWPWEMHQEVVKQRTAGKALINAWAHLTREDQAILQQHIQRLTKRS